MFVQMLGPAKFSGLQVRYLPTSPSSPTLSASADNTHDGRPAPLKNSDKKYRRRREKICFGLLQCHPVEQTEPHRSVTLTHSHRSMRVDWSSCHDSSRDCAIQLRILSLPESLPLTGLTSNPRLFFVLTSVTSTVRECPSSFSAPQ